MYHTRFKGTHYEAGYKWGKLLLKHNKKLDFCPTFKLTQDKYDFSEQCVKEYRNYFPELLEEIKGISEGNENPLETLQTILFSMYCFEFDNKCTCFAFHSNDDIIFGRNSDFLVSLEKLYMNCIYQLKEGYSFTGNTTAFVELEDGVNEFGLAVGLTFVYPHLRKPGFNAGMLTRFLLEKCKTVNEAVEELKRLPIASAQTLTIADRNGNMVVIECNPKNIVVLKPNEAHFVATANNFNSDQMKKYRNPNIDDWRSQDRYHTACNALINNSTEYSLGFAKNLLSGKYGFMCQYSRKLNADTVWSVIYDLKNSRIYRVEGNPSRKKFVEDKRFVFTH